MGTHQPETELLPNGGLKQTLTGTYSHWDDTANVDDPRLIRVILPVLQVAMEGKRRRSERLHQDHGDQTNPIRTSKTEHPELTKYPSTAR